MCTGNWHYVHYWQLYEVSPNNRHNPERCEICPSHSTHPWESSGQHYCAQGSFGDLTPNSNPNYWVPSKEAMGTIFLVLWISQGSNRTHDLPFFLQLISRTGYIRGEYTLNQGFSHLDVKWLKISNAINKRLAALKKKACSESLAKSSYKILSRC